MRPYEGPDDQGDLEPSRVLAGAGDWPLLGYGDSKDGCADCGAERVSAFVRRHPERGPVLVHICLGDVHGVGGQREWHPPRAYLMEPLGDSWVRR